MFAQFAVDRSGIAAVCVCRDPCPLMALTALAERKDATAAFMSRVSLNITSTRMPAPSMAR